MMLEPLSDQDVRQLLIDSRKKRESLVEEAFERTRSQKTQSLRRALSVYAQKRAIVGEHPTKVGLVRAANRGPEAILKTTKSHVRLTFNVMALYEMAFAAARSHNVREEKWYAPVAELFGKRSRLYFNLVSSGESKAKIDIEAFLNAVGYENLDYQNGYAEDKHGRRVKVGKILRGAGREDLSQRFDQDPYRKIGLVRNSSSLVVLSIHPWDVARMSLGRQWESCARIGAAYVGAHYIASRIRNGAIIANLIDRYDPLIFDPLARCFIKANGVGYVGTNWSTTHIYAHRSLCDDDDELISFSHTVQLLNDKYLNSYYG